MKKKFTIFYLILNVFFITSCNQMENNEHKPQTSKDIAAYINDSLITVKQLDNLIQQELFDELNRIYSIRNVTLDYMIIDKIFEIEAFKSGTTIQNYLDSYYVDNFSDKLLSSFIKLNKLENGILDLKRTLRYVNINSPEGEILLYEEYKNYLKKILADSLRSVYSIKVNLTPPQSPAFSLNNVSFHYRGNLNSKVTMLEISDLECSTCKDNFPIYKELYEKYKNKVKFGFTHFASYATLSAIACEYASQQGKFWEMHDSLFELNNYPDTLKIIDIAEKMELDLQLYRLNFKDSVIISNLENSYRTIHSKGIYATPTIIINNKAIFNSASFEEIENLLLKELE